MQHVPRSSNGAISHRRDQAQLWSDSTYMVPPFLAYYAAVTNNQTLMTEAYLQCERYREVRRSSAFPSLYDCAPAKPQT
jgi:rhamnogalacturonyl hydrolase YesR